MPKVLDYADVIESFFPPACAEVKVPFNATGPLCSSVYDLPDFADGPADLPERDNWDMPESTRFSRSYELASSCWCGPPTRDFLASFVPSVLVRGL